MEPLLFEGHRAWQATAVAAATFSESIPAVIGILARTAAVLCHRLVRPGPSDPTTSALRGSTTTSSIGRLSSASVSAIVWNPRAARRGIASNQLSNLVQGSEKTAPMRTLIDRRYSGSAQRGDSTTASAPNAAQDRMAAPTLVWSTMSSSSDDPAGLGEHLVDRGQREAGERGQRAPVDVEAGHLLGQSSPTT